MERLDWAKYVDQNGSFDRPSLALPGDPDAVLPGPSGGRVADLAEAAADRAGVRLRDDLVLAVPR